MSVLRGHLSSDHWDKRTQFYTKKEITRCVTFAKLTRKAQISNNVVRDRVSKSSTASVNLPIYKIKVILNGVWRLSLVHKTSLHMLTFTVFVNVVFFQKCCINGEISWNVTLDTEADRLAQAWHNKQGKTQLNVFGKMLKKVLMIQIFALAVSQRFWGFSSLTNSEMAHFLKAFWEYSKFKDLAWPPYCRCGTNSVIYIM